MPQCPATRPGPTPAPLPGRAILHVDMDAFFASVEQWDAPALRGKPVLVGYDGPRGVVAAASYEARAFGCRSAQPIGQAKRLCPHALILPVRFARYREVSRRVFALFHHYTPEVEPLSIDEAFLDVTGSLRLFGPAEGIAAEIKRRVASETGLTASVGVAANKYLAKLASGLNKPDGLTVLGAEEVARVLPPLPVGKMWGVGPKTEARLRGLGIQTFGDLLRADARLLRLRLGDEADHYRRLAAGEDERPVVTDARAKSIGQEQTFGTDLPDADAVRAVMLEQAEQVGERLRRAGLRAGGVGVKIRFGDFQTVTRSRALASPSDATAALWQAARELFDTWAAADFRPVRLIGVTARGLAPGGGQLELFADAGGAKQRRLDAALDRINGRFGRATIRRAGGGRGSGG